MPPEPLWIVGLPGSSVGRLTAWLGAHPSLAMLPELNLTMADSLGALSLLFERSQDRIGDGLLRCVAERIAGAQDEAAIERAQEWLWRRGEWTGAALLNWLGEATAPRRMLLPDTHLGWHAAYLARWRTLPKSRILHLLRHPADWCRDTAQRLSGHSFIAADYRDFRTDPVGVLDPQIAWYRFNHNLRDAAAVCEHEYRVLRLEDLAARPQATLDSLSDWLDVERMDLGELQRRWEPGFLTRGPLAAPAGMDPQCMDAPALILDRRAPGPWPRIADWRVDGALASAEVGELARDFGYPD